MLVDLVVMVVVATGAGAVGALGAVKFLLSKNEVVWKLRENSEHAHRFDTMLGDGKGWRCGICGKPRPEKAR